MLSTVTVLEWKIETDVQTAVDTAVTHFHAQFGYSPIWIYCNPNTEAFAAPPGAARVDDGRVPAGRLYLGDVHEEVMRIE